MNMFKGEILSQVQGWWTALTPARLVFGGGLLWILLLLIRRLVLQPIHKQIDELKKQQGVMVLEFNQTAGKVLADNRALKSDFIEMELRLKSPEGGTE